MKMRLNLRAEIDPNSGFCFGVVNAITKAEEMLKAGGKLYCLGQIVHNDEEVNRLEKMGLITVSREHLSGLHNETVLIRAHGEPPETYKALVDGGNVIIDATCPIVIKLQKRVKASSEKGDKILIFGKIDHPEIVGLKGQIDADNQIVFEQFEDLDLSSLPRRLTLYSQTTRSVKELYQVRDLLLEAGFDVDFKDTVCRQVSGRVDELAEFCKTHDKVVFVTGKNSSNGKVLFATCLEVNVNSYKITSPKEIRIDWFSEGDSVGICGGTSTPSWLMEEVKVMIESF
jgi:4-hydroxy-3-methylbut-2-enyl diphosphate reductase